ncbi:hypothetical protein ACFL6K_03615 [Candidatus Latescibacterota bacterium]
MKPTRFIALTAGLIFVCAIVAFAESGPNYTTRVYPGIDGKLVYAPDSLGNIIPDFSNAGYMGGGVMLPIVPNKVTLWGVEGDATPVIQAAIDSVSAMPADANGFRGAVLLRAGYYEMNGPVTISTSGVVLRGAGQDDLGTILIGKVVPPDPNAAPAGGRGFGGRGRTNSLINITGSGTAEPDSSTLKRITDDYVPVGTRTFTVENTRGYKVGDTILVNRHGNDDWLKEIGMDSETAGRNAWRRAFSISSDRIITAIDGKKITVDAPIMCAIETIWGGGDIMKYSAPGRIENCGIENIRGMSDFDQNVRQQEYGNIDRHPYIAEEYYSDENHWRTLITFGNSTNCWIRDITALHFVNSLVCVTRTASRVTIQDCTSISPVSQRWGARRFTYLIEGQLNLILRCKADQGRHNFVLGGPQAAGPNVFYDCVATREYATSEPHNQWSTGALWDCVEAELTARYWDYSIGWAGANMVFWNCEGDFRIQQPPTANNFTFGHIGINASIINYELQDQTKPEGYMESLDRHVTPESLFLKQLEDRLGMQAVANISK